MVQRRYELGQKKISKLSMNYFVVSTWKAIYRYKWSHVSFDTRSGKRKKGKLMLEEKTWNSSIENRYLRCGVCIWRTNYSPNRTAVFFNSIIFTFSFLFSSNKITYYSRKYGYFDFEINRWQSITPFIQ